MRDDYEQPQYTRGGAADYYAARSEDQMEDEMETREATDAEVPPVLRAFLKASTELIKAGVRLLRAKAIQTEIVALGQSGGKHPELQPDRDQRQQPLA